MTSGEKFRDLILESSSRTGGHRLANTDLHFAYERLLLLAIPTVVNINYLDLILVHSRNRLETTRVMSLQADGHETPGR